MRYLRLCHGTPDTSFFMAEVTHLWWGKPLQTLQKGKNNAKGFRKPLPACHIFGNPLPFCMELPFENKTTTAVFLFRIKNGCCTFGQPLVLQIPCEARSNRSFGSSEHNPRRSWPFGWFLSLMSLCIVHHSATGDVGVCRRWRPPSLTGTHKKWKNTVYKWGCVNKGLLTLDVQISLRSCFRIVFDMFLGSKYLLRKCLMSRESPTVLLALFCWKFCFPSEFLTKLNGTEEVNLRRVPPRKKKKHIDTPQVI